MTKILSRPAKEVTPEIVNEYFTVIKATESPIDASLFELASERYGVNWLGLWAMSIVETGWFSSRLLKEKRNLFGLGAIDSDPDSAPSFVSLEESAIAGAQHIAVYAGSQKVRDLPETAFVLGRTYQLLRWGWFGICQEFGELGGKDKDGKVKWASNPDHGRQVENLISRVTQYALDVKQEPELPTPKPKENWLLHVLTVLRAALPVVIKMFPQFALWSGAIYALVDILIRIFG